MLEPKDQFAPPVTEKEKPVFQDYKITAGEEKQIQN